MDAATAGHRRRPEAGHAGQLRDDAAGRHDPRRASAPMLEAGSGLVAGAGLPPRLQPGAGLHRPGLRRPAPVPQAGRRRSTRPSRRARRRVLRARCSTSTSAPTWPRPNGVWDLGSAEAAELAKLAETTYRDVNIGLANQFARYADTDRRRRRRRSSRPATASRSATSTSPGIAVGGHCIPVYPRMYLWNDPAADRGARRARGERGDARRTRSTLLAERARRPRPARGVLVLGAAYRGGVKETAFSGVFPTVRGAARAGRRAVRRRPDVHRRGAARRSASSRTPRARRWTRRSCRPTTPSTGGWRRRTCPASRRWSTAAG